MSVILSTKYLHDLAFQAEEREHAEKEVAALGNLRAGNSGVVLPGGGGDTAGTCPRLAHLRKLGISVETPSSDRQIMFAAGHMNETFWLNKLRRSWPGIIRCEEEIPTHWLTASGTAVTGRPDIVLCDEAGKPVLTYELKMVASVWTARDVRVMEGGKPKFAHMVQAAHYMWQLGTPGRLLYTSYVDHTVPHFALKQLPKAGQAGSEVCLYDTKGMPKKVLPFWVSYDLQFGEGGLLEFRHEGLGTSWHETPISVEGIRAFYEMADKMPEEGLGERPLTLEATGEIQTRFSNCSYCNLDSTCGRREKDRDYTKWLADVRSLPTTKEI